MRIVIDLQGAQSESRFRGIGRYSLALTQALIRHGGRHEILVALSGLFPDTLAPLRRELAPLVPRENVRVWHAPGPVRACGDGNEARRRAAELIREAFLARLEPDLVLVSSLFEGYVDDAVASIRRLAVHPPTAVILYDLIPLQAPADYLPTERQRDYYFGRIDSLKQADLLLAISQSARQEALAHLGVSPDRVLNISSAVAPVFCPGPVSAGRLQDLRARCGICRPVVLCVPGGFDARKNIRRLVLAWAGLAPDVRRARQLVIASRFSPEELALVRRWTRQGRLGDDEVVLTGHLEDADLIALYRSAELFVFPSVREGFGLPVLEAMACGAPAIGSNTSSVPEVIGRADALFDPLDVAGMSALMARVLAEDDFREDLRRHGLAQSRRFSWDACARRAIAAMEDFRGRHSRRCPGGRGDTRPRLAFVSPLPPQRTGIADYSAELLPALAEHYAIDLVTVSAEVDGQRISGDWPVRDPRWLRSHPGAYDRVLYHMGNSPFHRHMLDLLGVVPGTVVLHDFFLDGLMSWRELQAGEAGAWTRALFEAHGYLAVRDRLLEPEAARIRYPANWPVLAQAQGIIVHSAWARQLARDWYGQAAAAHWAVIPHLRAPVDRPDREAARGRLGIPRDAFVVGSFGFLDPTKCNHRLLEAWLASVAGRNPRGRLIFVGENHGGDYGIRLTRAIRDSGAGDRIQITGFAPRETFRRYLAAVDVAVQLRTGSRGETSGTVLDCMAHGLPTLVNAHGSLAELDPRAVWILPERFAEAALTAALDRIWHEPEHGRDLGRRARAVIARDHAPARCARLYADAVEAFDRRVRTSPAALAQAVARDRRQAPGDAELVDLARCIAASLPPPGPARRLFLDVTGTWRCDLKTGIERVARSLMAALLEAPPPGVRVEPVRLAEAGGRWHYRQAHRLALETLGGDPGLLAEEAIDARAGDILLRLDLSGDLMVPAQRAGLFAELRGRGVEVYSLVFDLLPVRLPQVFPPGADRLHVQWLEAVARLDGAICISRSVAEDLARWLDQSGLDGPEGGEFKIGWFHLGADFRPADPGRDGAGEVERILAPLAGRPTFLMVGTIEPRKGYRETLEAFSRLWDRGVDVNLVIVGREGWTHLASAMRRDIPATVDRLRRHPERGRRLFWLEGIDDAGLEKVYAAGTCLIAASYGEGFGLPLIEAARRRLPILARDIPVFREVAGDHAAYFKAADAGDLAEALRGWLERWSRGDAPGSEGMGQMSWRQSARQVLDVLLKHAWTGRHVSRQVRRKALDEHLERIHRARIAMVSRLLPPAGVILDLGGANCPLYRMGYPHRFQKLYLIDLPAENRHDMYKEIVVDPDCDGGEVVVRYGDMTDLADFADDSVDLVWSGQSIEHVAVEAGERMCREAFRVLRKGGWFCLDTPNRRLTQIHTRQSGGGFIHPEHRVEYFPAELSALLRAAGFSIRQARGICEMRQTVATGRFHYEDFLFGEPITENLADSYIQFYACVKD